MAGGAAGWGALLYRDFLLAPGIFLTKGARPSPVDPSSWIRCPKRHQKYRSRADAELAEQRGDLPRQAGATIRSVAHDLADEGWISSRFLFTVHAYLTGQQNALKKGEYAIEPGMTPDDVLALFASGRSHPVPGIHHPRHHLPRGGARGRRGAEFVTELNGLSDAEIIERLGMDVEHPEGWLFPDTYLFVRGATDTEILTRAYRAHARRADRGMGRAHPGRLPIVPPTRP
jgi:cell division protein YceG involved in septum cleavage